MRDKAATGCDTIATPQLEVAMTLGNYGPPSLLDHEQYRRWVIQQFEARAAFAAAEQAEREAPRPAEPEGDML